MEKVEKKGKKKKKYIRYNVYKNKLVRRWE